MRTHSLLIAFIGLLLITAGASSVDAADVTVGGGIAAVPDYIGSETYTVAPLPYFTVDFDNHMNVRLVGNRVMANLLPHPVFKAGVAGEFIGERDDVENDRVDDLEDVDASFMLGGYVGFKYEGWNGRIEYMADVADGNDGAIGRLALGWGTAVGDASRLNLEGYTTYGDDDFMSAYFGIDRRDANRSGLDRYDAEEGIYNVGLNVTHMWNFAGAWRLISIAGVSQLVGDADDSSPVVDEGSETQGVLGVMVTYSF